MLALSGKDLSKEDIERLADLVRKEKKEGRE